MKTKILSVILICFLLTSCHVGRFFIWNFADTKDQYKFQSQTIAKSENTFKFIEPAKDTSQLRIPRKLTLNGKKWDFEELLKADKTTAFLIIHKDTLIYENYFYKYDESTPHTSFSVAKSFVSALMGIAISEGHIKSADEPITNYLTFKNEGFNKITIQHVLDMRSGIAFNESYINPFGDVAKHYYGRNLEKYLENLKIEKEPNQSFRYISVNTQLLAAIIEKATGKPIYEYLEEKIWKPLGMEFESTWSVDSKKNKTAKAFCCLNARARDFAKFGRLYLNNGNWNGKQIVPAKWVETSTTFTEPLNGFRYKNQWWHTSKSELLTDSTNLKTVHEIKDYKNKKGEMSKYIRRPGNGYYAEGILGQFIFVDPTKDVVIVRLGKKYGKETSGNWASICQSIANLY